MTHPTRVLCIMVAGLVLGMFFVWLDPQWTHSADMRPVWLVLLGANVVSAVAFGIMRRLIRNLFSSDQVCILRHLRWHGFQPEVEGRLRDSTYFSGIAALLCLNASIYPPGVFHMWMLCTSVLPFAVVRILDARWMWKFASRAGEVEEELEP